MTDPELRVFLLEGNWPAVRAAELLDDPDYGGGLDSEGVYELTLLATGDKEQARKAMAARAKARMDANLKP